MIPRIQVIRIPQRIFPFTFFTIRIPVIRTPKIARRTVIPASLMDAVSPSASVLLYPLMENRLTSVELPITIFAFWRPRNVIKSPIPTLTAFFKLNGIALKIASLMLKQERIMKMIPSVRTAARATSQEYPIPRTTV